MLSPAFLDTLWTMSVIVLLFTAAGLSLVALPWEEREIRKVQRSALALLALSGAARQQVATAPQHYQAPRGERRGARP